VTCPWHGAEFGVPSSAVLEDPAEESVPDYGAGVDGNEVQIGGLSRPPPSGVGRGSDSVFARFRRTRFGSSF